MFDAARMIMVRSALAPGTVLAHVQPDGARAAAHLALGLAPPLPATPA